jgi:hypothetical protein
MERSLMLVTALAPKIGYDNAAKVAKSAHFAALDRIEPSGFVIDRAHRQPRRQRRNVDAAAERVGRAHRKQLNFRTAGRGSHHRQARARMSA